MPRRCFSTSATSASPTLSVAVMGGWGFRTAQMCDPHHREQSVVSRDEHHEHTVMVTKPMTAKVCPSLTKRATNTEVLHVQWPPLSVKTRQGTRQGCEER